MKIILLYIFSGLLLCILCSCSKIEKRTIEVTAYCGCGECNCYSRGSWKYLKLNFWNRYVNAGSRKGKPYTGKTASGKSLNSFHPGLFSFNSITHPWMIPVRIVFFPWVLLPQKGTIAADTKYYPFGTEMYVPGYGWGVVEDRGGAIKGPDRIDIFYRFHGTANKWGRQKVEVEIHRKKKK
jgi:3D domain-containing protein